jgi:hypothetical protein
MYVRKRNPEDSLPRLEILSNYLIFTKNAWRKKMSCQLINLSSIKQENSSINDLFQNRINILWSTKKRANFIINRISRGFNPKNSAESIVFLQQSEIQPGDVVKVRSKTEIQNILDDWGGTNRCIFTPEMYKCCDNQYKVLKKINYFYDEVKQKMCKCRNIVILEGVVCSGQRRLFPEVCDRNCFLFWHLAWLKKI